MERGIWQDARNPATIEEAQAVIDELSARNITISQQTTQQRAQMQQEEAQKRSQSILLWGGVGLAAVVAIVLAVRG